MDQTVEISKNNYKSKRILKKTLLVLITLVLILVLVFQRELTRLYKVITLFDPPNIVQNFQHMADIFPSRTVANGEENFRFKESPEPLISSFTYSGQSYDSKAFLKKMQTTGFIVIKEDKIVYESYSKGNHIDQLNISWSINKSFVSALVGIAVDEGLITSIQDPVSDYVPQLLGSGYEGVSIKNVLQMSSGVGFDEDYADFHSDINRMGRVIALGHSINEFAASLRGDKPQGTYHHYVSMDTQVLGMLLGQVTGMTPSQYLQQKLWQKMGMRSPAKWLVDDDGMELAFGTLNVTLRDYARFGRLYLNLGEWQGQQLVPKQWVIDSITPDEPHLMPGENPASSSRFGYGFQWWLPESARGDFLARGVYGQYIYVDPANSVVIVRTAANPNWRAGDPDNHAMVSMFQQIAASL